MTKQEIKEEYKMMRDPVIKSEQNSRENSYTRMMRGSLADVIANPQHYMIALKYDAYKNDAPVVIAGRDYIALK